MTLVASEARRWVGTPFVHGAAACGQGADCLGLIRGIWSALGLHDLPIPPYTSRWFEQGHKARLSAALDAHLNEAGQHWQAGDVLAFRMTPSGGVRHLGVLTESGDRLRFVHALSRHGVVEVGLSPPWQRRVIKRYRFPTDAPCERRLNEAPTGLRHNPPES